MDYKFIQPISMQVTKEQYERDLREPLLSMGYEEYSGGGDWEIGDALVTNFDNKNGVVLNVADYRKSRNNRYFIDHYNPQLFLAIAAMTKGEIPIVREWFVYTDYVVERAGYKVGVLYKNENPLINARWKRKATLQELIDKFTNKKQEVNMETKELIENLKPLIAPENMEKFNKLMGIERPMFKKEDFITGDKVIFRNGETYLVIRDCNAGCYGAQIFVLVKCEVNGGFITSDGYDEQLLQKQGVKNYDIMKIYRWRNGAIVGDSFSESISNYKLIWERE